MDGLDAEISVRHKTVRKAEYDLQSAQWALSELEEKLSAQKKMVEDTQKLLEGDEQAVVDAREALAGVKKDMDQVLEKIGLATNLLDKLREELANMKKASEVILEIKKYVSATTLKMAYYVDTAVRQPVRQIGLVEETGVWDYFSQKVSAEQCSSSFKKQLTDFHQYCTETAMVAFEQIKHIVDLTPLCEMGDKSEIELEEDTAVQERINFLAEDLQSVQSWLDPFRGTHMTKAKEQEKVDLGEPEGLRHVQGVYSGTKFYHKYLIDWKFGDGEFQRLLAQLTAQIQELESDIQAEDDLKTGLDDDLSGLDILQTQAQDKLQAALEQHGATLKGKNELESKKQALIDEVDQMKHTLQDLWTALELALAQYRNAKRTLVEEHDSGAKDLSLNELSEQQLVDMQ